MHKDNEKNETYNMSPEKALLLLKEGHKLLPANRGENIRKKLYTHLNKIVRPRVEDRTWKKRFNDPEISIPKKQSGELLPIMVESLMFIIQDYQQKLNTRIEKDSVLNTNFLSLIETYQSHE